MMAFGRRVALVSILALGLVVAKGYYDLHKPCAELGLERLGSLDRIRISDNQGRLLREFSDSANITALVTFAFGGNRRWSAAWLGKPVGNVSVFFLRGGERRGHFFVGRDFLSTFSCDEFRTTVLSPSERAALWNLLAVRDPNASSP